MDGDMTTTTLELGDAGLHHERRDELRIHADRSTLDAIADLARALGDGPRAPELARSIARGLIASDGDTQRENQVLAALMPSPSTLSEAATTQLRWNALAREQALTEFGALTSAQLATSRSSETTNPHTTPSRWVSTGRVFAVDTAAGRLFPSFQFVDGRPRPVIGRILAAMAGQLRGWELLLWFTASSGHLEGARPVDLLDTSPDEVVEAACYQASLSED
jgi:hypothetical protein